MTGAAPVVTTETGTAGGEVTADSAWVTTEVTPPGVVTDLAAVRKSGRNTMIHVVAEAASAWVTGAVIPAVATLHGGGTDRKAAQLRHPRLRYPVIAGRRKHPPRVAVTGPVLPAMRNPLEVMVILDMVAACTDRAAMVLPVMAVRATVGLDMVTRAMEDQVTELRRGMLRHPPAMTSTAKVRCRRKPMKRLLRIGEIRDMELLVTAQARQAAVASAWDAN